MFEDDDDDDFNPFTPETAAQVRRAGEALAVAVGHHAELVASASQDSDAPAIFRAGDELLTAVMAYVDAQFEHTGTAYPLGALHDLVGDDDDEDDEDDDVEVPTSGITVLRRADFAVEDEAAVVRAGRAAYLEVWPDGDEEAAAAEVTHLGRALYQIAHARGWDALDEVDGLVPTGALTVVHRQEDLLAGDSDEWPDDLFEQAGEVIYSQSDVWGLTDGGQRMLTPSGCSHHAHTRSGTSGHAWTPAATRCQQNRRSAALSATSGHQRTWPITGS